MSDRMVIVTTRTTLINTIYIPESDLGGMSDEELKQVLTEEPEAYGRDNYPLIDEADKVINIVRVNDE